MELSGGMVMLGSPTPAYQSPRHHAEVCDLARAWSSSPFVVDGGARRRSRCRDPALLEDNPGVGQRNYRAEDLEGWMFAQLNAAGG